MRLPDIHIVEVGKDSHDGIVVTFSDGTWAGYMAEELLELRPHCESVNKAIPIVHRMRDRRNSVEPAMARSEAIQFAERHAHLNRAQKSVVEDALSAHDRILGIQGYAGAGKTTTLATLRSGVEAQGYEVHGFAPTSRAARQLNEAGIESGTLQGFLARNVIAEAATQKHFLLPR